MTKSLAAAIRSAVANRPATGGFSTGAEAGLKPDDLELAQNLIDLEITARDLYDTALEQFPVDESAETTAAPTTAATDTSEAPDVPDAPPTTDPHLLHLIREQHEEYAQRFAGIGGVQATGGQTADLDRFSDGFSGGDIESVFAAAAELEDWMSAEHSGHVAEATESTLVSTIAAIAVMESRHGTILATRAGADDAARLTNEFLTGEAQG